MFPKVIRLLLVTLVATVTAARGQEAVSSIAQSRLFTNPEAPVATSLNANGDAVPNETTTVSDDESFGAQIILKNQERARSFNIFGDVSAFYTNNVDLRPHDTRSDFFVASSVGAAWRPTISRGLVAEISVAGSVFRYDRASELDFERISAGTGLIWLVPHARGIIAFARYDFTELLDSRSKQLLQDHGFAIGTQKTFTFGRSHFLTTGLTGVVGISTPRSQERDQVGVHAAYHLQITRSFGADLLYRYAAQSYDEGGRLDHNETLSLAFGLYTTRWLRVVASISAARNDSNRSAFDYEVFNPGGGVQFNIRF